MTEWVGPLTPPAVPPPAVPPPATPPPEVPPPVPPRHTPLEQLVLAPMHAEHIAPRWPQASVVFPSRHMPVASQQPLQLFGVQWLRITQPVLPRNAARKRS